MIRLIRFLITGDWHLHKWKTICKVDVYGEFAEADDYPRYNKYDCKCEVCGIHKTFRNK